MSQEIIVDTRELEAPEPMTLVLNTLSQLDENRYIKMIHRIEPLMLYGHLDKNNFLHKVITKDEDVYIYIWDNSFKDQNKFEDIK